MIDILKKKKNTRRGANRENNSKPFEWFYTCAANDLQVEYFTHISFTTSKTKWGRSCFIFFFSEEPALVSWHQEKSNKA